MFGTESATLIAGKLAEKSFIDLGTVIGVFKVSKNLPQKVIFYGRKGETVAMIFSDSVQCWGDTLEFFFGQLFIAKLDKEALRIGARKIRREELDECLTLSSAELKFMR